MKKKSVWAFGPRELIAAAIGIALYTGLALVTNSIQNPNLESISFHPAVIVPLFFGITFGPIAGFASGLIGTFLSDKIAGYGFWLWWDIGNGILGLIPGLIAASMVNYKSFQSILRAEIYCALGILAGIGVASLSEGIFYGASMDVMLTVNFLPTVVNDLVNGLIPIPLLMIAYGTFFYNS
jgi:energy-coupling factor transport system substrate-specific component